MLNILLVCNAGVSTSILAERVESNAKTMGEDCRCWAIDFVSLEEELQKEKVDVLLIGPQITYRYDAIKKICTPYQIPVDKIGYVEYGMADGKKVFQVAKKILEEK